MTRRHRLSRAHRAAEAERVRIWRHARADDADFQEHNRIRRLCRLYGLRPVEVRELFEAFYDRCAICDRPETAVLRDGRPKSISVDHDHESGRVRGVLCDRCNRALGFFGDDPDRLRRAVEYIENPPWWNQLAA